ncbi:hypothetical protein [Bauldia litoralis]|uniref:hypothetical protein n=1 Tax=Bauldia litoralis TaxID=665467 RepID=UPI0032654BB8
MTRREQIFAFLKAAPVPPQSSFVIASATGINDRMVRKIMASFLDLGVVEMTSDGYRLTGVKPPPAPKVGRPKGPNEERIADEKADAAARLALIPPDTRTLTGVLMGDPIPARSALARAS